MNNYLNKHILGDDFKIYKVIDISDNIVTATNSLKTLTIPLDEMKKYLCSELNLIEKEILYKNKKCLIQIVIPNDNDIKANNIDMAKLEEFKRNIEDDNYLYDIVNKLTGRRHDEYGLRMISNVMPIIELTERTYHDYNHSSCFGIHAKEESFFKYEDIYIFMYMKKLNFNKPDFFKNTVTYKHISNLGVTVFFKLPNPFNDKNLKNSLSENSMVKDYIKELCLNENLRENVISSIKLNSNNRISKKTYEYKTISPKDGVPGYKIKYSVDMTACSLFIDIFVRKIKSKEV